MGWRGGHAARPPALWRALRGRRGRLREGGNPSHVQKGGVTEIAPVTNRRTLPARNAAGSRALLSAEDEVSLARAWRDCRDTRSRDALLLAHRPLLQSLARRLSNYGIASEELVQDGFVGLLRALDAFDPERGVRFSVFGRRYALSEMLAKVRSLRGAVRIPLNGSDRSALPFVCKAIAAWEARSARPIDDTGLAKIAADLGVGESSVRRIHAWLRVRVVELDAPVGGDGGSPVDILASEEMDAEAQATERGCFEAFLPRFVAAVAALSERERDVLAGTYAEGDGLGVSEVARRYGVTHQRISQIRVRAIAALREAIGPLREDFGDVASLAALLESSGGLAVLAQGKLAVEEAPEVQSPAIAEAQSSGVESRVLPAAPCAPPISQPEAAPIRFEALRVQPQPAAHAGASKACATGWVQLELLFPPVAETPRD